MNLGKKIRELRIFVKVTKHTENALSEHTHIFAENRPDAAAAGRILRFGPGPRWVGRDKFEVIKSLSR